MKILKVIRLGMIQEVETQFGKKEKVSITVRDPALNDPKYNIVTSMFISKGGLTFVEGDTITAEVVKNGEYINLKNVARYDMEEEIPIPSKPFPPISSSPTTWREPPLDIKEEKVDWPAKEFRMVSMNALAHATEIVNQSFQNDHIDDKVDKVKGIADEFVKWVYRKRV